MEIPKFLLVATKNLPEVYIKVIMAKKLIAQSKSKNISEAVKQVFTYNKDLTEHMVNIHLKLLDEPGILSNVLSSLYKIGINIITVNQNIPVDSVAPVSITAKITKPDLSIENVINFLEQISGVVEARHII